MHCRTQLMHYCAMLALPVDVLPLSIMQITCGSGMS